MFFDHRGTKLGINNNIPRKLPNIWKLIYNLLNNSYVKKSYRKLENTLNI